VDTGTALSTYPLNPTPILPTLSARGSISGPTCARRTAAWGHAAYRTGIAVGPVSRPGGFAHRGASLASSRGCVRLASGFAALLAVPSPNRRVGTRGLQQRHFCRPGLPTGRSGSSCASSWLYAVLRANPKARERERLRERERSSAPASGLLSPVFCLPSPASFLLPTHGTDTVTTGGGGDANACVVVRPSGQRIRRSAVCPRGIRTPPRPGPARRTLGPP